ncbi:hypothetical protein [Bacillus mycoides]
MEFAYCNISCEKFITAGITGNILSEIVVHLVGYPFVALVGYPFVDLVGPFV